MSKPLVWAHRGASGYAPENTLEAFQKAADMGADGVELDIQLTRDGQIVVIHDEKIDRTSNAKGNVQDYTLDELKKLDFRYTFQNLEGIKIPTMQEVFELLKPTGLSINIEIKTGIIFYENIEDKILDLTAKMGFEDRVIYSSFNHYTIKKIKELNDKAKTGLLYADGTYDMPLYGHNMGVDALHPAGYNLQYPSYMEDCQKYGLDVNVWTINSAKDVEYCSKMGVHSVITNYPDTAREIINSMA